MTHSPLPWAYNPEVEKGKYKHSCNVIVASDDDAIMGDQCYYPWTPDEETMQFIVTACNSYYTLQAENAKLKSVLLDAKKKLREFWDRLPDHEYKGGTPYQFLMQDIDSLTPTTIED